jgi:anthranilate/para-aminobenzoate synthase component I
MTPPPISVFQRLQHRPGALWLDGGDGASLLLWDPVEVCTDPGAWLAFGRRGGIVAGYLAYEAGSSVAPVPAGRPTPEPPVWLGRYTAGLRWSQDGWEFLGDPEVGRARLADAATPEPPPPPTGRERPGDRAAFLDGVRQIQAWIAEGDCYQVNLARQIHVDDVGPAWAAWQRLRASTPAEHGAFLRISPDLVVASNSPELLLAADGEHLRTVPIKGTRPRGEDAVARRELFASEKERAELTMIVDLCRNDLGRVAAPGSVVAGERTLVTLPTVHHAVQPVRARLAPGNDAWDALAALFPPGSVIGAPKIRAAQRIRELEPEPRGVYCGALGYTIGTRARWSVAIRTAVFSGSAARLGVGAGIVADSDAEAEWAETGHKARAWRQALVQ